MTTTSATKSPRIVVPRPERVRKIAGPGFGWIDARIRTAGWLEVMSPAVIAVYTFLCLAANRQGVSWYRRDTMWRALGLDEDELHQAIARLIELDLVAYRPFSRRASDGFHQVLAGTASTW